MKFTVRKNSNQIIKRLFFRTANFSKQFSSETHQPFEIESSKKLPFQYLTKEFPLIFPQFKFSNGSEMSLYPSPNNFRILRERIEESQYPFIQIQTMFNFKYECQIKLKRTIKKKNFFVFRNEFAMLNDEDL